jgi:hypothetical protein
MSDQSIQGEILDQLIHLPLEKQRQVLEFARTLRETPSGRKPGKALLQFAGTIEKADLLMMAEAIEQGCEQVNHDEW